MSFSEFFDTVTDSPEEGQVTYSQRWRFVSEFSARNTGAISKTRSRSQVTAICLYSCGDCARQAFPKSMYCSSKTAVPPSEAPAMILGEWNSVKFSDTCDRSDQSPSTNGSVSQS